MVEPIKFTIPGKPMGKGRPRFSTFGGVARTYTPETTREYEELVRQEYVKGMGKYTIPKTARGITAIICAYYPHTALSRKSKKDDLPQSKPDADNIAKIILDALNGIAYRDDAEITLLIVRKSYSDNPRVTVNLSYEEEYNEQEEENTK